VSIQIELTIRARVAQIGDDHEPQGEVVLAPQTRAGVVAPGSAELI
jgi:hypothetical protein